MLHGQFERNGYIVSLGIQVNDLLHFLVHVGKPALLHYTTLIMHTPIQTFLVWSKGNLYQNWYQSFQIFAPARWYILYKVFLLCTAPWVHTTFHSCAIPTFTS